MLARRFFQSSILRVKANHFSTSTQSSSSFRETKVKVLDLDINYIETPGSPKNGPTIFFLPGAFGSIEMDYKPIMHEFDHTRYKLIAWDPPGHGKSRPPKREYLSKRFDCVYEVDVQYATELMNALGQQQYFILAWSGATITGIVMAAQQSIEKVRGLITWGGFGHTAKETIPGVTMMKNLGLNAIPENRRRQLLSMYGEEYLLEMWNGWCDEAIRMTNSKFRLNGPFRDTINKVQCPTLIIQGLKDALINMAHVEYLNNNISNSRFHVMENGTHNLHLKETKEFVKCVQDFVDANIP